MHTRVIMIKDTKRVRALICAAIGAGSRRGLALKGLNRRLRRRLHDLRDNEVGHIDATCVRILLRHSRQGPVLITVLVGTNNAVQVGALSFHEESIGKRRSREALLVKNVDIRTVNAGVVPEINRAEREWFRLLVGPNIICVANLDKAFAEQNTQVRSEHPCLTRASK
jgi:hypothetical protein